MTKTSKIIPRGKQILVQPDGDAAKESKFGILTPSSVEEDKKAIGTVKAVGSDVKDVYMKPGKRVIYGLYAGERLKLKENEKDVEYVLLFDEDVLAFLE